ncbi:MAG: DUF2480 family protein [Sphingomonadales bacterium]|nr:DUF2480 family protein [Sphingomonadales bacterium]
MEEIRNKVKESGLVQLDLAAYKPKQPLVGIDLSEQLWQGLVLKEKDFREWIKTHNWQQYTGKAVYIYCSTDAIIPTWAFMLVSSALQKENVYSQVGSEIELAKALIQEEICSIPIDEIQDQRVIVKGCADIQDPAFAMSYLVRFLQPYVKSIMYGEPCSTVPIFKK